MEHLLFLFVCCCFSLSYAINVKRIICILSILCPSQEADIAVNLFTQTEGRTSVADPSSHLWYDQFVLVFKQDFSAPSEDKQMFFYTRPFSLSVYLLTSGCLLSVLLLLLLLERCEKHLMTRKREKEKEKDADAETMLEGGAVNMEILIAGLLSKRE